MKLTRLRIEKFRAIRQAEINLNSITALVGQNSAGKSTMMCALNAFFNFDEEKSAFESGRHDFQKNATPIIEIEFVDVPSDCHLPRVRNKSNVVRLRLKYRKTPVWHVHSDGKWGAAPTNWRDQLSKHFRYVYVPLKRDHEVVAWGAMSLLRKAVEAWVENQTKKRDTISPKIAAISQDIQRKTFDALTNEIRKVVPVAGNFLFELGYAKQPDYTLLVQDLALSIKESGRSVALQDSGSGTQSLAALALYSFLAELEKTTYLLGIEEPEQNLHPHMQRDLISKLKEMSLQVVISTHSPAIVDSLNHEDVVLCRRTTSPTRGIEVVTTQLSADFWSRSELDREKYVRFYERKNSEFFFADFIIITEGITDAEIVQDLVKSSAGKEILNGVSIISLDGKKSLPYIYHLLKELGLKYAIILDKDYFLDYLSGDKGRSRDKNGYPRYKKDLNKKSLASKFFPSQSDRQELENLFKLNHSKAMSLLEREHIFCFRWELEIDLVASAEARVQLCKKLSIPNDENAQKCLLIDKKNALKELEIIGDVILNLEPSKMPNSYKRIRKILPKKIKDAKNKMSS